MSHDPVDDEVQSDKALRPLTLGSFSGQPEIVEQLDIFMLAAKQRGENLEHVLLFGPPGLGKTTLANIIANEMGGPFTGTSGPMLQSATELAPILVGLDPGAVLFIDEIHRIPIQVEEILYSAMEDGFLDILIGEPEKKTLRIELNPFTLVGATTKAGNLSAPLMDRFGFALRLQYYKLEDLTKVVLNAAQKLDVGLNQATGEMIASRSRGTPRIALKLLRRVRDVIQTKGWSGTDREAIIQAFKLLGVNDKGLSVQDLTYLRTLVESFSGGPVGLNTMSAALSEDTGTIEDTIEPYLIQEGYIQRTARGRVATPLAQLLFDKL